MGSVWNSKSDFIRNGPIRRPREPLGLRITERKKGKMKTLRHTFPLSAVRRGFTLLELLIVIAIIAIIAGMLLPTLNRARERANSVSCISNLRQVQSAVSGYADDHRGIFPNVYGNSWSVDKDLDANWIYTLYQGKYLTSGGVFICRSQHRITDDADAKFLADPLSVKLYNNGSYGFNWLYLGTRFLECRNGDRQWNLFCFNNGQSRNRVRKPSETISLVDVARGGGSKNRGSFVASYFYIEGNDEDIIDGNVDPRHSGGCNIAWVDGHVSHVNNINRKNPYTSDPFRNGDRSQVGDPANHWDCE